MTIKFHVISDEGSAFPLAWRLQRDGHDVTMEVTKKPYERTGEGLVPRASAPAKGAIVICDATGQGKRGAALRAQGFAVIGGNAFDKELELDRPEGARIMRLAGIKTPPTFPFKRYEDAQDFLKGAKGAWFVKVSGAAAAGGASTYDASDATAMIRYLAWCATKGECKPFELQQKIDGTEVSCNGWFDGEKFVTPFDLTLEEKRFMSGDLGQRTGCESCLVWHAAADTLGKRTVARIADDLRRERYVGPVDCNSLVADDGTPVGLEWTARLGFDATQAWMRLFDRTLGAQLAAFAHGELRHWEGRGRLSGVLRVSVPPYPSEEDKELAKAAGLPVDRVVLVDHDIDPQDVTARAEVVGGSCIVCTVGAVGDDLARIREDILRKADDLEIPNKQFRNDPLARAERDLAELRRLKLA